jgi:hypothetical protein
MSEKLLETILLFFKPVLIGTFGGVASVFVAGKKPDAGAVMYCICVSGFSGWLAGRMSDALELTPDYKDVVIGVAGFLGAVFLTSLATIISKKIGIDITDKFETPEKRKENVPEKNKKRRKTDVEVNEENDD